MYNEAPKGTLSFELFGVPVQIQPISWVILALIGGGFGIDSKEALVSVLLFVVAGMLTLLAHEFGHALVGRRVGAGPAAITIAGLGGVTQHATLPPTRQGYFAMVAAGPLGSLAVCLAAGLVHGLLVGKPLAGVGFSIFFPLSGLVPMPDAISAALTEGWMTHPTSPFMGQFLMTFMMLGFWWTVFNLFPVFPLDGGKLLGNILRSDFKACRIGLFFSALLVALAVLSGSIFNMMICGWLAYMNYQYYRLLKY